MSIVQLFNPRQQLWGEHFRLNGEKIEPLTAVGRVTVHLLNINSDQQSMKRTELIAKNRYPCMPKVFEE